MPPWSLEAETKLSETFGIQTSMLSLTCPGACCLKREAGAKLARDSNEFCTKLRDGNPRQFGVLAALPTLLDKDLVLQELDYAYDVLNTDGITLFTRYGDGHQYLGHPDFEYVWDALNKREAVVFIHPTTPVFLDHFNSKIPQPLVDFPLETTKTAIDILVNGILTKYPKVKIILPHGGGAFPYLVTRPASVLPHLHKEFSTEGLLEEAKRFYYDVAICGAPNVLKILQDFVEPGHLLFGSDFPYAPWPVVEYHVKELENFAFSRPEIVEEINYKNALALFPRLAQYYK